MYKPKTYRGEMRQYLKQINTHSIIDVFLKEVNPYYLRNIAIKYLSNPDNYVISELEELFNNEKS